MTAQEFILRVIAFIVITVAVVGTLGGQLIRRERLPDQVTKTYTLTMYPHLPPAPLGPRFCDVVDYGDYAMAMPCNFRPPFVDWLEGKRY